MERICSMQDAADIKLDAMSVAELRELQAEVEQAIRAVIRQRAQQKAAPPPQKVNVPVDLEQERDAWLARRR